MSRHSCHSVFSQLILHFILSTSVPFLLIAVLIANVYSQKYRTDSLQLFNTSVDSIGENIAVYLKELDYITLTPYYSDEFIRFLSLGEDNTFMERYDAMQGLNNFFSFIRYTRSDLEDVLIVSGDQCLYYSSATNISSLDAIPDCSHEAWYRSALETRETIYVPPHVPAYFSVENDEAPPQVFSLVRQISSLISKEPIAIIKFDLNVSLFDQIFQQTDLLVNNRIFVADNRNQLIYSQGGDAKQFSQFLAAREAGTASDEWVYLERAVEPGDWKLYVLLGAEDLQANTAMIYVTALCLYLCGCLIAFLIFRRLSLRTTTSLSAMGQVLQQVGSGDFSARYVLTRPGQENELDLLGSGINRMIVQLDDLIQKEYLAVINQKNAEYAALQARMQPHFLLNTLSGFIGLCQSGQTELLETGLYRLCDLLRYVMTRSQTAVLEEELQFIRDYLELQSMRFSNRFSYAIDCPQELANFRLPRLLLQPLVENSIHHGVEPCMHFCQIQISISSLSGAALPRILRIVIQDNGIGFDPNKMKQISQGGIGIHHIQERLRYLSPLNTMTVESAVDAGCCITITLREVLHENIDC